MWSSHFSLVVLRPVDNEKRPGKLIYRVRKWVDVFRKLSSVSHSRDRDEPQYWWPCSSKIVIAWQSVAQIMHLSISDLSSPFFLPSLLVTPAKLSDWSICEERSKLQDLMPHKIDIQNQWMAQVPKYADQVWYLKAGAPRHGTPTSGGS